jgi:molybdopterin-guanine dinucleotide biosynthesis protein A
MTVPAGVPESISAAVILAGGRGQRLGGLDKPALLVDGRQLLDVALDAARGRPIVVVGPPRALPAGVLGAIEDPPGGGPAAGVAAGFAALPELPDGAIVAVLAADLPGIGASTVDRLSAALGVEVDGSAGVDGSAEAGGSADAAGGAVLLDPGGRRQYLIGVWRYGALRAAISRRASWHDAALRDLLAPISVMEVSGSEREAADIDTPADLGRWQI